jgi:hypothetical protein
LSYGAANGTIKEPNKGAVLQHKTEAYLKVIWLAFSWFRLVQQRLKAFPLS